MHRPSLATQLNKIDLKSTKFKCRERLVPRGAASLRENPSRVTPKACVIYFTLFHHPAVHRRCYEPIRPMKQCRKRNVMLSVIFLRVCYQVPQSAIY